MRKLIQALALGSVLALSFHNVYAEGEDKGDEKKADHSQVVYEGEDKGDEKKAD